MYRSKKMFDLKFVIIFEQLCGKTLEGEEKFSNFADGSQIDEEKAWSETPAPKMDALIALMETASSHSSEETKKIVKALLDTRTNERWATAEVENKKAREDAAKVLAKPAPRKSAAIRIEVCFFPFLKLTRPNPPLGLAEIGFFTIQVNVSGGDLLYSLE